MVMKDNYQTLKELFPWVNALDPSALLFNKGSYLKVVKKRAGFYIISTKTSNYTILGPYPHKDPLKKLVTYIQCQDMLEI